MPTQIRGDQIQSESVTSDNILNDSIIEDDLASSITEKFYKVKVNSGDSTGDYLGNKITAGSGISISTGSTITISASGGGGGSGSSGGGGASGPTNTVPTAADFPTTVLAAGSVTDTNSALILKANAHGASFDMQQILQTAPSSPWSRYYRFEINPVQKQYLYGGFVIKNSSTGAFVIWSLIHTGSALEGQYSEYSSTTSRSSYSSSVALDSTSVYFKVEDDGTNFVISAAPSGEAGTYVTVYSVSRNAFLTSYDQIGFGADAYNSSSPNRDCIIAIQHYSANPPTFVTGGDYSTLWNSKVPPSSPNSKDDEFDDESLATKWTEYDPTSILTVSEDSYGLKLVATDDPASQNAVAGIRQAVPSSDEFEIVSHISIAGTLNGSMCGGLFLAGDIATNPTTAPLMIVYLLLNTNGQQSVEIVNLSNRTTWSNTVQTIESRSDSLYLAMQWKTSTGKAAVWYSYSGVDWVRLTTANYSPGTVSTANYCGIFANPIDTSGTVRAEFFRVREASSGIIDVAPLAQGARVQVSGATGISGITLKEASVEVATNVTTINVVGGSGVTDNSGGVVTIDVTGDYTVTVDVQSGTSGTYTKPAGALIAIIDLWGGSGGGGGGSRQDGATAATGGASGQAGEWLRITANPSSIDGLSWSGGAGGSGGSGRTGSTGNGNGGGAGSDSTFAGRTAAGGSGGSGGFASSNTQGGGTSTSANPAAAAARSAWRMGGGSIVTGKACGFGTIGVGMTAGSSPISGADAHNGGGASGGHGGGLTTIAAGAGGNGGAQGSTIGGTGGGATGAAGNAGTTPSDAWLPGSAGGGGGANNNGAGGTGGAAGRGCGGAGGGAGRNGDGASGAAGADGGAVIRTICLTII